MIDEVMRPVSPEDVEHYQNIGPNSWGGNIVFYDKNMELSGYDIAIFGVKEDRNSTVNMGCKEAPDAIRQELYGLIKNKGPFKIIDIGNLEPGETPQDTYVALKHVVHELMESKIFPLLLGGTHDLTFAQYLAFETLKKPVHLVVADERINMKNTDAHISDRNFLGKIFTHEPNFLFNFSLLGYQSYFADEVAVSVLEKMNFDTYRLGVLRDNMEEAEPVLRDADIFSFDMECIKYADAPGVAIPSPNGFYSEEVCRLMRYAGLSNKLSTMGIYNYHPISDERHQTAQLIGQMVWYFVDGFYARREDDPFKDDKNFVKFTVEISEFDYEIVFYKSKLTERWWMQLYDSKKRKTYFVPCTLADYQVACNDEIPDKWLRSNARIQ